MKPITIALALTLTACSSSCGGTSKPNVNWPGVVSCTEPAAADLLTAVRSILLAPEDGDSTSIGDRAVAELEQMAQRHGAHVVACLVDEAVRGFQTVSSSAIAAAPSVSPDVPAEPARKSLRAAPAPSPEEPVQTLPDDRESVDASAAAARGRDFLQRVARTKVEEGPKP